MRNEVIKGLAKVKMNEIKESNNGRNTDSICRINTASIFTYALLSLEPFFLKRNNDYIEVATAVFQNDFIEPATGLQKNNEEPFVFLNGIRIPKLVSCCENLSVKDGLARL